MTLRPITQADVEPCASLHCVAFPGFFLSELGEPFLREFYRSFVDSDSAVSAVALGPDGEPIGVVVGTTNPSGFFRRLLAQRWFAFALASVVLAVRRPRYIPRLLRAVRYRGVSPGETNGALLSSICVSPSAPPGTGRRLLAAFVASVAERGVSTAHLTTDSDDNDRVNRFYTAAGWRLVDDYTTPEGRRMNCYLWDGR